MRRLFTMRRIGILLAVLAAVYLFAWGWPMHDPHPRPLLGRSTLVIRNVRILVSPDAEPIESGSILIQDGRISAVGREIDVPASAQTIRCDRCTATAGFWNAHVHFTEPKWLNAAYKSSSTLNGQLADMLTSRGFTTVVDAGSDLRQTLSLRRRIESGDLLGPTILTAGAAIYPEHGIPYYLGSLPFYVHWFMPMPGSPTAAASSVRSNIANGGDLVKLFTGSYVARGKVLPMKLDVAVAAVEEAHREGQLVYAHPSDFAGTKVAVDAGVDVLAHAPDNTEGIDRAFLKQVVDHNMAMIPTLKMFATTVTDEGKYLDPIYDEVRTFRDMGGELLFGTDVGYMSDYSTQGEFEGLAKSGLSAREVLRMLTTNPAGRFHQADRMGTIEVGKFADVVLLRWDSGLGPEALSNVRLTIRHGQVVYQNPH
jgi:imidazolonepropionase-like amidohydrolase